MALRPGSFDIYALAGEKKIVTFQLFEDDDQTVPHDLTDSTVTIVLTPSNLTSTSTADTLTVDAGLTIDARSGLVTMTQDTTAWPVGRGRWYMKIVDPDGNPTYPLRGVLFVGSP